MVICQNAVAFILLFISFGNMFFIALPCHLFWARYYFFQTAYIDNIVHLDPSSVETNDAS